MQKSISILFINLLMSCSSTQLVESYKSPDIGIYEPYKVLVAGLTSDEVARKQLEEKLKNKLVLRSSEVIINFDSLAHAPNKDKMTEEQIDALEQQLIVDGYDTILLTKMWVQKTSYRKDYSNYSETYKRCKDDYLFHQKIFYNPDCYEKFQIYKAETTMSCICPTKDR